MSREVKRESYTIKGNVPGAKALIIDDNHQDNLNSTIRFIEEGIPGTFNQLLEESNKGSFDILRGVVE